MELSNTRANRSPQGWPTQRKVAAAILALAAGALILDRAVLGTGATAPDSAAAYAPVAPAPQPSPAAPAAPAAKPEKRSNFAAAQAVASRLDAVARAHSAESDVPDAFAPAAGFFPKVEAAAAAPIKQTPGQAAQAPKITLRAMTGKVARVELKLPEWSEPKTFPLSIGQSRYGLTLLAVEGKARSATFAFNEREIVLSIDEPRMQDRDNVLRVGPRPDDPPVQGGDQP